MSERILCKPTPWFLLRAGAMIAMFGVFAVLFFVDGHSGYREKNRSYYIYQAFKEASEDFAERESSMDGEQWRAYAAEKTVELPEDLSLLPVGLEVPVKWPEPLLDYDRMKESGVVNRKDYFDAWRLEAGVSKDAPDKAYSSREIFEQWVFAWLCLALTLATAFVLFRTLGRRMWIDGTQLQAPGGKPVAIADLVRLDLRKWETKGLAFAWAKTVGGGERKLRIDGLTYGGFKKEEGEPAEKLMQDLRSKFVGEIIDYEVVESEPEEAAGPKA